MIQITEKQGRKTLELRQAELVYVGELATGKSLRTGNEWKARTVNIKFSLGTNAEGKPESMTIAAKCLGDICDRVSMVAGGTTIHAFIRLELNLHFKIPQTECMLVDFTL